MSGSHDEEVLGKAYDARLMRRLLTYLRPYWRQVVIAFVAIVAGAGAQLAQPYLMKLAIDQHIAHWAAWRDSTASRPPTWLFSSGRLPRNTSRRGRCS